jgi:hypothetical protein
MSCAVCSVQFIAFLLLLQWARVELLKLRFGESSMHGVEVMMKDIQESRRTNTNVVASLKAQASKRIQLASQHQVKRQVTSASPPVHSNMHGNMALFASANASDSHRDFESTDRRPNAALCFASVSSEPRSSNQLRPSVRHSSTVNPSQRLQFVTPDTPDVVAAQTSQFSVSFDLSTSPISFDDQSAVRNKRRHESPDDQLSPIPTSDSSSFVRSPFVVGTRQSATAAALHFTPAASVQHSPPESHSSFVDHGLFSKTPAAPKSSTDGRPPPSASISDHLLNGVYFFYFRNSIHDDKSFNFLNFFFQMVCWLHSYCPMSFGPKSMASNCPRTKTMMRKMNVRPADSRIRRFQLCPARR